MLTRVLSAAAIVFATGTLASAQVEDAAKARLQAMADSVRQANSITYSASNKGSGGFFSMIPEHRADVAMLRDPQTKQWKIRYSGTRAPSAGQPALDFIVVSNGTTRTWVDDSAKQVIERPNWNSENVQQVTAAGQAAIRELALANPFEKDLGAGTIKLEAQTDVNGTKCDVVLVDPGSQQPQTRYYIAADNLPRKVEQILGEMGSQAWILSNVQLNPPINDNLFKVDVPTGYTFVPAAPAPAPAAPTATPGTATPVPAARVTGTEVDQLAPDFSLTSGDGQSFSLSGAKGSVIVLDFWGTWCIPCRAASPKVQALHEKYKDEPVRILGLAVRETSDENPKKYMADNKYTYGLLLKADDVAKSYKVRTYPMYFVIGKEGQIVYNSGQYKPETTLAEVEEAIEIALGKKPPKPRAAPAPAAPAGDKKPAPAKDDGPAPAAPGKGGDDSVKREAPAKRR
jgi:thiol-disulfide isomerase/thioredoxin/outer membrane lipoprotein-sorting protein